MARQRARSERAELVNEYRSSGQSAYRFSLEHGVAAASLSRWILEDVRDNSVQPEEVAFVRVEVAKPALRRSALLVEVGGARVQVESGFDAELLRDVVTALRGDA